jgi:hypothetical protein
VGIGRCRQVGRGGGGADGRGGVVVCWRGGGYAYITTIHKINQVAHYYWPAMPAAGQLRLLPRVSSWRKSLAEGGGGS